ARNGAAPVGVARARRLGAAPVRAGGARGTSLTAPRQHHGESELLDALVAEKPHTKRYSSREELDMQGVAHLHDAVALLQQKATPEEVDAYKKFTLTVAEHVAEAHKEGGQAVSPEEQEAIGKITAALNAG